MRRAAGRFSERWACWDARRLWRQAGSTTPTVDAACCAEVLQWWHGRAALARRRHIAVVLIRIIAAEGWCATAFPVAAVRLLLAVIVLEAGKRRTVALVVRPRAADGIVQTEQGAGAAVVAAQSQGRHVQLPCLRVGVSPAVQCAEVTG